MRVISGIQLIDGRWWGVGWPRHSNRYGGTTYMAGGSPHFNENLIFHEIGHCFGLYHKENGVAGQLDHYEARWLSEHYHFNDDQNNFTFPTPINKNPLLTNQDDDMVRFELEVTSNIGLHQAQIFRSSDIIVLDWDYLNGERKDTATFEVHRNKWSNKVFFQVMDTRGNYHMTDITIVLPEIKDPDTVNVYTANADCTNLDGDGAKPIAEVAEEDLNTVNDYDEVVEEDDREGVIYLAVIGGSQPQPNGCGLIPKNAAGQWTGWGGPLNFDNVTIGEGGGTRNRIVIGGTYFERGIGAHAVSTLIYDLTGGKYLKFEAYVGMSDEKDPADCGHGGSSDFRFTVDGKQMFKSGTLRGSDGGKNVAALKVEFDIPSNAKELTIVMGDGGDGIDCDHSTIGDAKLLTAQALAVEPANKLTTIWGHLKARH